MLKKVLLGLVILSGLFVLVGLFISPELDSNISANGRAVWKVLKLSIIKYYSVIIGLTSFITGILFYFKNEKFIIKYYLLGIAFLGLVFIFIALVFSPSYSVENFTPLNYLNDDGKSKLLLYQIMTILLGWLLTIGGFFLFAIMNFQKKVLWSLISIFIGTISLIVLLFFVYVNPKYPSNIILNFSEYGKVEKLLLGQDILLSDFEPKSTLKVNNRKVVRAKFPVIDFNAHLSSAFRTEYDKKVLSPENLIKSMDSVGLQIVINTDVENGDLESVLNRYHRKYPDRFLNLWPTGFTPGIMTDERLAELPGELERAIKMGAVGEGELWKNLGLKTKDTSGKVIPVDDPRIAPLWDKAAELDIPVLWHMGDPAPTFLPVDRFNERFEELGSFPEWSYYGPQFPSRETIMKGRENVLKNHPNTKFIGCHMGWNSDNLEYAGYLLDTYPNYYLDLSTTLSELGRQPYTARKFFIKYQDRIVFGTDGGSLFGIDGWTVEKFYQAHWEFLETENEYIKYPMQGAINQGSWRIYGINLPDNVLEKIYYKNAEKLLNIKIDYKPNNE